MAQIMQPPPPVAVHTTDDDSRERLEFRLWQLFATTLTIMVAVWFSTFGIGPAILAWVIAKHILVAILMIGLHRYPRYKGETQPRPEP
jgi:uncharacterized membrane protein